MKLDSQLLINALSIIGGVLGIVAFLDVRRKRSKVCLKKRIAKVEIVKDKGAAQSLVNAPAFELILINKGLITMYPAKFFVEANYKHRVEVVPEKPFDVLVPGRSIRHKFSRKSIYEKLPARVTARWRIILRPIVVLEDEYVCMGLPFIIDPKEKETMP